MTNRIPVLALLLLAACGGREAPLPTLDTAAEVQCREAARDAPDMTALSRRVVLGQPASEERFRQARRQAEARAFADCLQRRGLSRGGGVEPIGEPGF